MEKLPQELLHFVVEDIQTSRDLQAIRLVNKALATAAAPSLFHTIPVWLSLKSLQRLTWLSEHPGLAHHVHTIILSPLRLIDRKDLSAYETSVRDCLEFRHASLSSHALSVGRHLAAYKSYIEEQRFLTAKDLDVKILGRAFSGFINLQELNIDFWNRRIGAVELMNALGPYNCNEILTNDCEYTLPVVFRALSGSRAEIKTLGLGQGGWQAYDPGDNPDLGDAVYAGFSLLSSPRPSSRGAEMTMLTGYPERLTPQAMYKTFSSYNKFGCKYALRGLRELAIGQTDVRNVRQSLLDMVGSIRRLIGFALSIETFTMKEISVGSETTPTLRDVFGTHHLKNLRKLDLEGCDATQQHLIDFFTTHCTTVTEISLGGMRVTDSDWSTALTRLRALSFPALESFILDYCLEDLEGAIYVEDYITHRTDKDPIIEEEERQNEQARTSEESDDSPEPV